MKNGQINQLSSSTKSSFISLSICLEIYVYVRGFTVLLGSFDYFWVDD